MLLGSLNIENSSSHSRCYPKAAAVCQIYFVGKKKITSASDSIKILIISKMVYVFSFDRYDVFLILIVDFE